jgi:hypothetical protein
LNQGACTYNVIDFVSLQSSVDFRSSKMMSKAESGLVPIGYGEVIASMRSRRARQGMEQTLLDLTSMSSPRNSDIHDIGVSSMRDAMYRAF